MFVYTIVQQSFSSSKYDPSILDVVFAKIISEQINRLTINLCNCDLIKMPFIHVNTK